MTTVPDRSRTHRWFVVFKATQQHSDIDVALFREIASDYRALLDLTETASPTHNFAFRPLDRSIASLARYSVKVSADAQET